MCIGASAPKVPEPPPPPPAPIETVRTLESPATKKNKGARERTDRSSLLLKTDPKALNASSVGSGLTIGS
jgi:hypothetical protein